MSGFIMMMTQQGKLLYISENAAEYLGHSMVKKRKGRFLFCKKNCVEIFDLIFLILISISNLFHLFTFVYFLLATFLYSRVQKNCNFHYWVTFRLILSDWIDHQTEIKILFKEDLLIHGDSVYDVIDKQDHAMVQNQLARNSPIPDERRLFLCRINVSRNSRRQLRFGDQKVSKLNTKSHFFFSPRLSNNEFRKKQGCSSMSKRFVIEPSAIIITRRTAGWMWKSFIFDRRY